jgi:hypothetical protein
MLCVGGESRGLPISNNWGVIERTISCAKRAQRKMLNRNIEWSIKSHITMQSQNRMEPFSEQMSWSANPWNGSEGKQHDTRENKPQSQTYSKLSRELGIKHKKPWMPCKLTKQEMFTCGYYFLTLNDKFQQIFTKISLQTPVFIPTSKHILKSHS